MQAYFDEGWEIANEVMLGGGKRTIFSPWITEDALEPWFSYLTEGDRILVKGDIGDIIRNCPSIELLKRLLKKGVEIRRLPQLHAKVYLRESNEGFIGWIGSANLTIRGKGTNTEAMAGIFVFDEVFLKRLEETWNRAEVLDNLWLENTQKQIIEIQQRLSVFESQFMKDSPILAVRLRFKAGLGSFSLKDIWLNIRRDESWDGVKFPTIPFFNPRFTTKFDREVDLLKTYFTKSSIGAKSVGEGVFFFKSEYLPEIEKAILETQDKLNEFEKLEIDRIDKFRIDFENRLVKVLAGFLRKQLLEIDESQMGMILRNGRFEFEKYRSEEFFTISNSYFVPIVGGRDLQIDKAIRELLSQNSQIDIF